MTKASSKTCPLQEGRACTSTCPLAASTDMGYVCVIRGYSHGLAAIADGLEVVAQAVYSLAHAVKDAKGRKG